MNRIVLLVDEIANGGNLGIARDINTVIANAQMLFSLKDMDFEESLSLNDIGFATFLPIGKYICYLNIRRDKSKGEMLFINTNAEMDRALDIANILFKEQPNLINAFMKVHQKWCAEYTEELDIIKLRLTNTGMKS